MNDHIRCIDCFHLGAKDVCQHPIPCWVGEAPRVKPLELRTCATFSQRDRYTINSLLMKYPSLQTGVSILIRGAGSRALADWDQFRRDN